MAGFGGYNPYPRAYGGGRRAVAWIHEALLEEYRRLFNVEPDSLGWCESYGEAGIIAAGQAGANASHNALVALRAAYSLTTWERAFGLTPSPYDTPLARRQALDARFRAMNNNAESDLRDVCERLMGVNFALTSWIAPLSEVTYWPGINPGQPPLEWWSKREILFVEVTKTGLTQDAFNARVARLTDVLDDLMPAWMSFDIYTVDTNGTDLGFILDLSLLDEAAL